MNLQNIPVLALQQHIEKTIKLSETDFEQIAVRFKLKTIRRSQYLLQEGDVCNHDYFVVKGALRQYYMHDNKELINQFAFENWWVSDWYSMLNGSPSRFYIDALENSEVLYPIEKRMTDLICLPAGYKTINFLSVLFPGSFGKRRG